MRSMTPYAIGIPLLLSLWMMGCGDKDPAEAGSDDGADGSGGADGAEDSGGADGADGSGGADGGDGSGGDGSGGDGSSGDGGDGSSGDGGDPVPGVDALSEGELLITEVMVRPGAVADVTGQWIELRYVGAERVDLLGLVIESLDAEDAVDGRFEVGGSLVIEPGGRVVIGASLDPALNGGAAVDWADPAGPLLGPADALRVRAGAEGATVDALRWDAYATFPGGWGHSLSFCEGAADRGDGLSWRRGASPFGLGDLGTPGAENDVCGGIVGPYAALPDSAGLGEDALFGSHVTVSAATTLVGFGTVVNGTAGSLRFGLYSDNGGAGPGALIAESEVVTITEAGRVQADIAEVPLPAGDYWVVSNVDRALAMATANDGSEYIFRGLPFADPLPSTFGVHARYTYFQLNHHLLTR